MNFKHEKLVFSKLDIMIIKVQCGGTFNNVKYKRARSFKYVIQSSLSVNIFYQIVNITCRGTFISDKDHACATKIMKLHLLESKSYRSGREPRSQTGSERVECESFCESL